MKTGAVAPDVGKLNPGKLMKDQIAKKNTQQKDIVSTAENKVKPANIILDSLYLYCRKLDQKAEVS